MRSTEVFQSEEQKREKNEENTEFWRIVEQQSRHIEVREKENREKRSGKNI